MSLSAEPDSRVAPLRRRRTRLCLVAFVAVLAIGLGGLLIRVFSSREPVYEGKSLSVWMAPLCQQTRAGTIGPTRSLNVEELWAIRRAVTVMGSNAVPFLVAKLDRPESALHRTLRKFGRHLPQTVVRLVGLNDPQLERVRAIRALAEVGPVARPAIPSLVRRIGDPVLSPHVTWTLVRIGPDGMQALANLLTNSSSAVRRQAAQGLGLVGNGPASSNIVVALLPAVDDPDPLIRQSAIRSLGTIGAQPELVLPALLLHLSDPDMGTRLAAKAVWEQFDSQSGLSPGAASPTQPGRPP